jgi:streptogrisin B
MPKRGIALIMKIFTVSIMAIIAALISITAVKAKINKNAVENRVIESVFNEKTALEIVNKIHNTFQKDEDGFTIFPEYYGGEYIDDNGTLVLQIIESDAWHKEGDFLRSFESNGVSIEFVQYSTEELKNIIDYLNRLPWNEGAMSNVVKIGIPMGNNVVVTLRDFSEEQIDLFKKSVLDTPIIRFEELTGGEPVFLIDVR